MNIHFSLPLSNGFERMKKALFQPFDISKWFRIGFTAWLAGLTDCNGGGNGSYRNGSHNHWDEFFSFPQTAWNWLIDNPLWFNLIIVGLVILFIVITVFVWISSRGKFMFLHNVANDKSDISEPWHEYRKEGNSLFIWQFIYGWFAFAVFMLFLIYCFVTGKNLYYGDYPKIVVFWSIAVMILMFIGYLIIFGYISMLANDFVVPVMYKYRIGIIRGWTKFLGLFFPHFFSFIGYGLFKFVLGIAVAIAVVLFALFTCCIGLLLLAIPYIGAVLLLPVSYTFRAFSIEFLKQYGSNFDVFPKVTEESM